MEGIGVMANEIYLQGAGESLDQIGAQNNGKKRKNWWIEHRMQLLLILVVLIGIGVLFYTLFFQAAPDYRIGLITSYTMPSEAVDQLEARFAQYGEDINEDGKVIVSLSTYSIPSSLDTQQRENTLLRLEADIATDEVLIFLYNEDGFAQVEEEMKGLFQYSDGTPMGQDATDFENARESWSDFAGLAQFEPQATSDGKYDSQQLTTLFDQLWVSTRTSEGRIEESYWAKDYYDQCMDLLERVRQGETTTAKGE